MSTAFDLVCSRLEPYQLRMNSTDRGRSCCPVCGERNPNTLSVGVTATGAVLVKCFKLGCDIESICAALGLDLADLFPPRESHGAPRQRRRLISAAQALDLLNDEAQLVALCGSNIAHGVVLTDNDRGRCLTAAGRIAYLRDEVYA